MTLSLLGPSGTIHSPGSVPSVRRTFTPNVRVDEYQSGGPKIRRALTLSRSGLPQWRRRTSAVISLSKKRACQLGINERGGRGGRQEPVRKSSYDCARRHILRLTSAACC